MFKFLHAADIHLDSPLLKLDLYEGAPAQEVRRATRRAFENLVDLAITEKVSFVLISGDLYDGDWKDYNTGLYFLSQVKKLCEADISLFMISGNHDAASRITKTLRLPPGVHRFASEAPETVRIERLHVAIHAQSFETQAVRKDLSQHYPSPIPGLFNIGMLHTCVTGREGHEPYAPCTVEGLCARGYDYWALGHVHQRETLRHDPLILFPGNIQGRHIRETGPKGCVLVSVDHAGRAEIDFRPLDVIRWFRVSMDASDLEDGYGVIERAAVSLKGLLEDNGNLPLIARIEVRGESRAHEALTSDPERWTNELRSMAMDLSQAQVWIEKVEFDTRSLSAFERGGYAPGPIREISELVDEIRSDPHQMKEIGSNLRDLIAKLPPELRAGDGGIPADDPEWLIRTLDRAKSLLIHRLLGTRGPDL